MKLPKVKCEICGNLISVCNYSRHKATHYKLKIRSPGIKYSDFNAHRDDLFCKFCGVAKHSLNSLSQHEIRCKFNPDRITVNIPESFNGKNHPSWNKGLTKDTDERVLKASKKNSKIGKHDILESELDDDGKLFKKYCLKKSNAKIAGVRCLLTFHEYCLLVQQAGLKSSDLGYSGNKYDLARYNDIGDYTFESCRFISHSDNVKERKLSDVMLESIRKAHDASMKHRSTNTSATGESIKRWQKNSRKCQEMHQRSIEKLTEPKVLKDPRYSGVHNSSYGTHWITDGVNSRKWRPDEEPEIPEGWRLGRVMNN